MVAVLPGPGAYALLWLYGVEPFSPELLSKLLISGGILLVPAILPVMIIPPFFRHEAKGYDTTRGQVAHPGRGF